MHVWISYFQHHPWSLFHHDAIQKAQQRQTWKFSCKRNFIIDKKLIFSLYLSCENNPKYILHLKKNSKKKNLKNCRSQKLFYKKNCLMRLHASVSSPWLIRVFLHYECIENKIVEVINLYQVCK